MENLPTVAYWMGEPLAEMSPERLIEIITQLGRENERLRGEVRDRSIAHVNDLARAARARLGERKPLLARLLG